MHPAWEIGGYTMPRVGVICNEIQVTERIQHTMELLIAREGFDCRLCILSDLEKDNCRDLSYVVLSCKDRTEAFAYAEMLWCQKPSLHIIYMAYTAEDIFAALTMPFFHTVRMFDLEQDLKAAFEKISRIREAVPPKISFIRNGKMMLIPRKEILYLESEHHEIRLHLEKDVLSVSETLTQWDAKLKGMGFVRTDRSFLVNMYHIRCLEKENILMDNGECLYISRRRYPEVKCAFENYIRHLDFL